MGTQRPELRISMSSREVRFDNNEVGFSEENVLAICNIGKSTKDRFAAGFIGNKGIGFKSVFKMTPRPRVHSRGFHLQFDASDGGLGWRANRFLSVGVVARQLNTQCDAQTSPEARNVRGCHTTQRKLALRRPEWCDHGEVRVLFNTGPMLDTRQTWGWHAAVIAWAGRATGPTMR